MGKQVDLVSLYSKLSGATPRHEPEVIAAVTSNDADTFTATATFFGSEEYSRGGRECTMPWPEMAALLTDHKVGPKAGGNWVFSRLRDGTRGKKYVLARTCVALDIEPNKATGALPPTIAEVAERLDMLGLAGALYSTHSHKPETPRYRIILPLNHEMDADVPAVQMMAERLGLSGVLDASKVGAESLFYTARHANGSAFEVRVVEGKAVDADELIALDAPARAARAADKLAREEAREARKVQREARIAAGTDAGMTPIEAIRANWALEDVLLDHGYDCNDEGRWIHPDSDSGIYGAEIVIGDDSVERLLSYNGGDPLNLKSHPQPSSTTLACDVVDALAILDFGGNRDLAIATLAPQRDTAADDFADLCEPMPAPATFNQTLLGAVAYTTLLESDCPPPEQLLGGFITLPSMVWVVGATGVGKTQFLYGAAVALATGTGFLHWQGTGQPVRVLVIDGEMGNAIVKQRVEQALARSSVKPLGSSLLFLTAENAEGYAKQFPELGEWAPLNTKKGAAFIQAFIAMTQPDVIVFDNFMSLAAGDKKDTLAWEDTKALALWLKAKGKAQVWADHTLMDGSRQYGDSSKRWLADTVAVLLKTGQLDPVRLEFTVTFSADNHGKARHRSPTNWKDFEDHAVVMSDMGWHSAPKAKAAPAGDDFKPEQPRRAESKAAYAFLREAIAANGGKAVSEDAWRDRCASRGLFTDAPAEAGWKDRRAARRPFTHAKSELVSVGWVKVEGDAVTDARAADCPSEGGPPQTSPRASP